MVGSSQVDPKDTFLCLQMVRMLFEEVFFELGRWFLVEKVVGGSGEIWGLRIVSMVVCSTWVGLSLLLQWKPGKLQVEKKRACRRDLMGIFNKTRDLMPALSKDLKLNQKI